MLSPTIIISRDDLSRVKYFLYKSKCGLDIAGVGVARVVGVAGVARVVGVPRLVVVEWSE